MPDKTNSELIRELSNVVATLGERERALRRAGKRRDAAIDRLSESLTALSNRVAVLEQQVADVRKSMEERGRRWWSLVPSLLGAIIGAIGAFLGQLLVYFLQK